MQLFSIGIDDKDMELKELIRKKSSVPWIEGLYIEENRIGDLIFLNYNISHILPQKKVEEVKDRLRLIIADTLSDMIMEDMQSVIVQRIIQNEYFYIDRKDQDRILRDALAIMWGGRNPIVNAETIREQWRYRIWDRIMDHLDTNDELVFDGFVTFRLKDFINELEDAVERAVDDLLIENEYNEFIKLLQYFVEIQDPKMDEVHVLQQEDKRYILLDSDFKVIHNEMLEQLAREITDKEISHDDLLISSLITIAPCKITIHEYDKIKNIELLNTINNVFTGKVVMSEERITPKL
ncbi:MAG: putative sporulation protein YtxC [Caldicoprobacterales bacterium]|nr:putative sporulation protein YtxC [Clostridiales bacterium]